MCCAHRTTAGTPSSRNVLCHGMPTKRPFTMCWKDWELPYKERICPSVSFFFLQSRQPVVLYSPKTSTDTMSDDKHDEQDEREKQKAQEEHDKFLRKWREELPRGEDDIQSYRPDWQVLLTSKSRSARPTRFVFRILIYQTLIIVQELKKEIHSNFDEPWPHAFYSRFGGEL